MWSGFSIGFPRSPNGKGLSFVRKQMYLVVLYSRVRYMFSIFDMSLFLEPVNRTIISWISIRKSENAPNSSRISMPIIAIGILIRASFFSFFTEFWNAFSI